MVPCTLNVGKPRSFERSLGTYYRFGGVSAEAAAQGKRVG